MAIAKIQTGDKVKVTAGKFKGSVGQVTKVITKTRANGTVVVRAAVSGLPTQVKYQRGAKFANYPGSMYQVERLVDVSNLSLVNKDGQVSKSKVEDKDGKMVRVLKKGGEEVVKQRILKDAGKEVEKKSEEKKKKTTKAKKEDK